MCCGLQMTAVRDGAGWRVFDGAGWRMRQIVMSRTTAHTGRRASVYEGPRKTNQRGKKRGRSMILTDTPVQNALERKPRRWKEPQAVRWRERSFRIKKWNLLNDKKHRMRDRPVLSLWRTVGNSRPGDKWVSCTDCGKCVHEDCTSRDRCYVCHNYCESN